MNIKTLEEPPKVQVSLYAVFQSFYQKHDSACLISFGPGASTDMKGGLPNFEQYLRTCKIGVGGGQSIRIRKGSHK